MSFGNEKDIANRVQLHSELEAAKKKDPVSDSVRESIRERVRESVRGIEEGSKIRDHTNSTSSTDFNDDDIVATLSHTIGADVHIERKAMERNDLEGSDNKLEDERVNMQSSLTIAVKDVPLHVVPIVSPKKPVFGRQSTYGSSVIQKNLPVNSL